jgi:hypothetical protein
MSVGACSSSPSAAPLGSIDPLPPYLGLHFLQTRTKPCGRRHLSLHCICARVRCDLLNGVSSDPGHTAAEARLRLYLVFPAFHLLESTMYV